MNIYYSMSEHFFVVAADKHFFHKKNTFEKYMKFLLWMGKFYFCNT